MSDLTFELKKEEIHLVVENVIKQKVLSALQRHDSQITADIEKAFEKVYSTGIGFNPSDFEKKLHWSIERTVSNTIDEVVKDINLSETIIPIVKNLLNDPEILEKIARKKIFAMFEIDESV